MIEVEVEDEGWSRSVSEVADLARGAAAAAAAGAVGEIVILLTDDETLKGLNGRFLGKDGPTNVLAFPSRETGRLGDIALAFGVCAREAGKQSKPLPPITSATSVVHGVLHLRGYDHTDEARAARMEGLERELLAAMNIPDPYGERTRGER